MAWGKFLSLSVPLLPRAVVQINPPPRPRTHTPAVFLPPHPHTQGPDTVSLRVKSLVISLAYFQSGCCHCSRPPLPGDDAPVYRAVSRSGTPGRTQLKPQSCPRGVRPAPQPRGSTKPGPAVKPGT